MLVKRGEIYYADLSGIQGSEQGGVRPFLIIQNDVGNKYAPTVVGVPITSRSKKPLPTHVKISTESGLKTESTAMFEQVRTLDKTRLKSRVGSVGGKEMSDADKAIIVTFGMSSNFASKQGVAMAY